MLSLTCIAPHPALPALTVGVSIIADDSPRGFAFHIPPTRNVLRHILTAIHDGALRFDNPPDQLYEEMERRIMRDRDLLLARAAAKLATLTPVLRQVS